MWFVYKKKWKGQKARETGNGYKLYYYGTESKRNGVEVFLDPEVKKKVIGVEHISDSLFVVRVEVGEQVTSIVSAYAPQTGCSDEEKDDFWDRMAQIIQRVAPEESI